MGTCGSTPSRIDETDLGAVQRELVRLQQRADELHIAGGQRGGPGAHDQTEHTHNDTRSSSRSPSLRPASVSPEEHDGGSASSSSAAARRARPFTAPSTAHAALEVWRVAYRNVRSTNAISAAFAEAVPKSESVRASLSERRGAGGNSADGAGRRQIMLSQQDTLEKLKRTGSSGANLLATAKLISARFGTYLQAPLPTPQEKLQRLRTVRPYVVDNSIRESTVVQIYGHVAEDKDAILDALAEVGSAHAWPRARRLHRITCARSCVALPPPPFTQSALLSSKIKLQNEMQNFAGALRPSRGGFVRRPGPRGR